MQNFSMPVRVYIGDTDAGGIVYYANYLDYMERARTENLRAAGVELGEWHQRHRRLFVVRGMCIDYLKPARYNDLLDVHAKLSEIRKASMVCEQLVVRDGQTLVSATVRLACIDADSLLPAAIPQPLRETLTRER